MIFEWIKAKLESAFLFVEFVISTLKHLIPPYARFDFFFKQFIEIGIKSILIILVVGAFVGMVLAIMTYQQFSKLGIESLVGPFIAVPMVSQLGPIMTALMLLCRVGSAMTAEIGSMRVTEQIDALHCFGINPIKTLIVPRAVICAVMLPALTVLSDVIGILGGYLVGVYVFGINESYYMQQTRHYFEAFDVFAGLSKAFVFGILIAVICCFKGFYSRGGATGVGKSIMQAVVYSFIAIILVNFFMSLMIIKIWNIYYLPIG